MSDNFPFFSIIMPAYNAERFLAQAMQSVIEQTFKDWELIVINDGSTDDSIQVLERFADDERIKCIHQQNRGLAMARNAGLLRAKGLWIAFLDADDIWLENKLAIQFDAIKSRPSVDVIYSDGYTLYEHKPVPVYYHFEVLEGYYLGSQVYENLFLKNFIPVLSVAVKREWVEKIGLQDENVTSGSEDWDYWLRLARAGANFFGLKERLFIYRVHGAGMSANLLKQRQSSFEILMKNFNPDLLPPEVVRQFVLGQLPFIKELRKIGLGAEAENFTSRMASIYPSRGIKSLLKRWGMANFLFTLESVSPLNQHLKKFGKKLIKIPLVILFTAKSTVDARKNLFNSLYHRWKYLRQIEYTGLFYMHKTASINIGTKRTCFISHGVSIYEYSQINLETEQSYLLTGCDVVLARYCNFNIWDGRVLIGNNVVFNNYSSLNCMVDIQIGNNTWFGEGVRIYDHNHRYRDRNIPFTEQGFTTGRVKIGNNCWIGSNTVILQNVEIGDNCVIGANNLIYKSLPKNSIVKSRAMETVEQREYDSQ